MVALNAHKQIMLDMLTEVDRICKKHGIRYMLFAGSMLGAIRHHGFIPWDDDLDIVMLRSEYDRFLSAAPRELDPQYFLQREFSDHWPIFFSKLRKNGTACIERHIPRDPELHQGIYIDIFPCDNLYENGLLRRLQFLASKVVIAKSLDARGYLTDSMMKKAFIICCRMLPMRPFLEFTQHRSGKESSRVHTFFGATSKYPKGIFERKWLTKAIDVPFETGFFPVSACYDEMLTTLYGDYMIPLAPEKRGCKVHAEIVDTDHSYEEYIGIQSTMSFKEYTRSIR